MLHLNQVLQSNTTNKFPKKVQTTYKKGERTLLSTGIDLFIKVLLEVWTCPGV